MNIRYNLRTISDTDKPKKHRHIEHIRKNVIKRERVRVGVSVATISRLDAKATRIFLDEAKTAKLNKNVIAEGKILLNKLLEERMKEKTKKTEEVYGRDK